MTEARWSAKARHLVHRFVGLSLSLESEWSDGWSFVPEAKIRKRRTIGPQDLAKREARRGQTDGRTRGRAIFSRLASPPYSRRSREWLLLRASLKLHGMTTNLVQRWESDFTFVQGSELSLGRFLFSIDYLFAEQIT